MERKHFIDNLRWLTILMLFPFHAAQIWSGGAYHGFYVWSHTNEALFVFSNLVYPWFMTLMFTLAGMSMYYAMKHRTKKQFIKERATKLIIPLIFGVFVLCPLMTYIGEVFFNGYTGTYLHQYVLFFTKETDMTGYRSGFTPGHLWFLIYLFVISLLALLIIWLVKKLPEKQMAKIRKIPYWLLVLLFLPEWGFNQIMNIGGKSVGQFLFLFLVGYFILINDEVLIKLKKNRYLSLVMALASGVTYAYLYCIQGTSNVLVGALYIFYGFTGILTLLGFSQTCLNFTNKLCGYFAKASYPIYILHQPLLVVVGFFVLKLNLNVAGQFFLIVFASFLVTLFSYEVIRRIPGLRFMIGISGKKKQNSK